MTDFSTETYGFVHPSLTESRAIDSVDDLVVIGNIVVVDDAARDFVVVDDDAYIFGVIDTEADEDGQTLVQTPLDALSHEALLHATGCNEGTTYCGEACDEAAATHDIFDVDCKVCRR